ncbi:DUF2877 domain-containing protein [Nocardiopsis ansamitocini]|uniref:DUF2877 domain-containing protein n=1 Tax=Nocardiopsis ansamitocini TaxID=1670832 RepID=A0A9W6P395_9ACTN|nr:DUF2877 domain-containing protein [Nocardiopsis ansamitocini]GLU46480.1 hypothetical protein Nans01_08310 [Nocardiopsis ansamitocini]
MSGPFRPARVLGAFRSAVYLELEDSPRPAVVAVLAHDAVRLPNGVVLAEPQSVWPFADVAPATSARIGRCSVVLDSPTGSLTVQVGRWWRPSRPRPPAAPPGPAAAALAALGKNLADTTGGLSSGLLALLAPALDDPAAARRAAHALVGLGPGLTPSGDDAVCGFVLAVRHLGNRSTPLTTAALRRARTATTSLSATLLEYAARGEACPQAVALIDAVAGHAPVGPALTALRTVGHTSGTDLALGVLAGAGALTSPSPPADRERP